MRRQVLNLVLAGWCVAQAAGGEAKKPVYLDCFPDKVMVYPGEEAVSWEELQWPTNAVEQLLADVEAHKTERYVVVLARPTSAKFFRKVFGLVHRHALDAGYEAMDDVDVGQWNAQTGELVVGKNKPAPTAKVPGWATNRSPVYFECRGNEVFYVDKEELDGQVQQLLRTLPGNTKSGDLSGFIKAINTMDVGNKYYKVIPQYLLTAIMALEPRPGVKGEDLAALRQAGSEFKKRLTMMDQKHEYVAFFVRDDAFATFHGAREEAQHIGLDTTWNLLGNNEPLKFGQNCQVGTD